MNIMMEKIPAINKTMIQNKAKDAWTVLTETEMELKLKLNVTPLGVIAFAAGVGATVCVIHALHKADIKRALRKQKEAFEAEVAAAVAEAVVEEPVVEAE